MLKLRLCKDIKCEEKESFAMPTSDKVQFKGKTLQGQRDHNLFCVCDEVQLIEARTFHK
jgi:hypothetical protein